MRSITKASVLLASILVPVTAFALEGIGPRVTVQGTIEEIRISAQNKWDEYGGEMTLKATNGQNVTIIFQKDTKIISEGRLSRRILLPSDIKLKTRVRITGLRQDTNTIKASLFVITNIETNAVLAGNGTIESINGSTINMVLSNGEKKTFSVTNETEVILNYTIWGANGLTFTGKYVHYTMNPDNTSQIRILRIIGDQVPKPTANPSTVDVGRREEQK